MDKLFQILAVILAGVAAYFYFWKGDTEKSFIAGVLAAAAFFLNVRFRIKDRLLEAEEEKKRRGEEENFGDDEEFEDGEESDIETPRLNEMPARAEFGDEPRTTNDERFDSEQPTPGKEKVV
ncbi:MAG: hypothetical protein JSS81_24120 [Acidobacteria bacterium]|nr:hypothetical protein [Acidobacteriota bacterium]